MRAALEEARLHAWAIQDARVDKSPPWLCFDARTSPMLVCTAWPPNPARPLSAPQSPARANAPSEIAPALNSLSASLGIRALAWRHPYALRAHHPYGCWPFYRDPPPQKHPHSKRRRPKTQRSPRGLTPCGPTRAQLELLARPPTDVDTTRPASPIPNSIYPSTLLHDNSHLEWNRKLMQKGRTAALGNT